MISFDQTLIDVVADRVKLSVKAYSPFRKGYVTKIEEGTTPNLATVNGRQMCYGDTDLEVGDLVLYGDYKDPFVMFRLVGADVLGEITEFD